MNCRAKNWDFKTNIWCVDEIVVYCACAEWCPPLLAGWLQYIIPGVWRSVWCTAHVLNGVPTIRRLHGYIIPGVRRSLLCTAHTLNGVPHY